MTAPRHWRMAGTSRFDGPGSYGTSMAKTRFAKKMRAAPTGLEKQVGALIGEATKLKVHRQVIVHGYIADFYLPVVGLVIEADGPLHQGRAGEDAIRDFNLRRHGIETVRITHDHVRYAPALCVKAIAAAVAARRAY